MREIYLRRRRARLRREAKIYRREWCQDFADDYDATWCLSRRVISDFRGATSFRSSWWRCLRLTGPWTYATPCYSKISFIVLWASHIALIRLSIRRAIDFDGWCRGQDTPPAPMIGKRRLIWRWFSRRGRYFIIAGWWWGFDDTSRCDALLHWLVSKYLMGHLYDYWAISMTYHIYGLIFSIFRYIFCLRAIFSDWRVHWRWFTIRRYH